jgi:aspartate racemase
MREMGAGAQRWQRRSGMKRIGLIGGMSWESTAVYYRLLNERIRDRLGGLHSADLVLRSVDFAGIAALQQAGRWDEAGERLAEAAADLKAAGAGFGLICTNTMHVVFDRVAAAGLPLVDIIDVTARALLAASCRRPLLLATRYTMEHGFYSERMQQRHAIAVRVPDAAGRDAVHRIIYEELCRGIVSEPSRKRLMAIIDDALRAGADAVILGCTEICLILDPADLPCPGFDSTALHVDAAVDEALANPATPGASPA